MIKKILWILLIAIILKDKRKFEGDLFEDNKSIKKNKLSIEDKNNDKIADVYDSEKREFGEEWKMLESEKVSWKESVEKLQDAHYATSTSTGNEFIIKH